MMPGFYTLSTLEGLTGDNRNGDLPRRRGAGDFNVYRGLDLDLLTDAGMVTNPAIKNDILSCHLLATGSDHYDAVYSLGELGADVRRHRRTRLDHV
jgi:hypothetical protein